MCSYFLKNMENYNIQGDLAEIFHVSAAATDGGFTTAAANPEWQFPTNFCFDPAEDFGQPFSHIRDPFTNTSVENTGNCLGFSATNNSNYDSSSNQFSRMTISSSSACESQVILNGPDHLLVSDNNLISSNGSKGCLLENPADMQISSPRNTGIKRRKSQAKKVVCIPAPTPAKGSWSSGEVVPSDLWAWRKYGQKPIKGSPHPRGYYRCSSSKGCLAKKQVERSRNDPNMLVITYTSEHNHPWPTQRNALAGSSRSQPHKNKITAKNSPKNSTNPKEDHNTITTDHNSITIEDPSLSACVKEETDHQIFDNRLEMDDPGFDEGFRKSYKPTLLDSNQLSEDSFFSDLGEIEGDPLDLFFMQGFSGRENKGLDPFSFHDWVTNRDS